MVGILSSQTQILYDALLRVDGGSNTNVIRDDNNEILYVTNDYTNLLPREIKGIDYSIFYKMNTELGDFTFTANAANLTQFDQGLDPVTQRVVTAQENGNEAVLFDGETVGIPGAAGDLLTKNGRPEWRSNIGIRWQKDNWGAGIKYKYISELENVSLSYFDDAGDLIYQQIDDWSTVDAYASYSFTQQNSWLDKTKLTLGARNLGDKEPPFTSGTFGYEAGVHSSAGRYLYMTLNKKF